MKRFSPSDLPAEADLLVIGGGITGASVARDAALRGLSVVLVERDDFASGTSSRSSKLIHGGLRYLQTYQFRMVHESVRERETMMRVAPHLADLQPFMYLLYDGYPEGKALLNLGLTFYDAFSRAPLKRRHRMIGRDAVLRREPHLNPTGLKGAGLYQDALTDDARLVIDVLQSAAQAGALLANHREVTGLIREHGRITGAEITDRLTDEHITVRARTVVNAAGPWVDRVLGLEQAPQYPTLRPTKGVHIVLRTEDFPLHTAVFLRSPADSRVVWPTPAGDGRHVYVGTTDTAYHGSLDDVAADEEDFAYLLQAANHALPGAQVDAGHIVASWAGLRPLIAAEPGTPNSAASREHTLTTGPYGMITAAGGKLTTARLMAAQIVDIVAAQLRDLHAVRGVPPSTTGATAVSGGGAGEIFRARQAVATAPVAAEIRRRWLRRYGGNATALARTAARNPADGVPLDGSELTRAEIRHAIHHDMAMTVSDVLIRRTGSFFWAHDGDAAAIGDVSDLLDDAYGYPPQQRRTQQDEYRRWVARNRGTRSS
ncbi:glycerol-3-phosphate dehydrogenase/oxidase [Streptomyces sp. NBC_01476]|uniref:glycerol-3-phosphate dehydrogenase/oxidase n=1 Tax=Streptomyces sp. NBC_01476 TaxID=2903881 RepID=UPI002E2F8328|nr:glycerol-3-phosphate dehydrogenase/oxidase [Streptomyces sp. NBC_01476]